MIHLSSAMPDHVYHATKGVTFHRLMEFIHKGPAWYAARYVHDTMPAPEAKDWGNLGQAYHIYALEGEEEFSKRVITTPKTYLGKESAKKDAPMVEKPWNMNANACQEWCLEQTGKIILNHADYTAAVFIGRNFRANQHSARLLSCGWPELTIETTEPRFPVPVKGRIDWLASTTISMSDAWAIVDPKGTVELESFEREAIRYNYHRQMAWYRKLVREEIGKQLPVFLVAVEKDCMHRVRPFQCDPALLDMGEEQNNRDLDKLAEHYAGKPWSLDHEDHMRMLSAPAWMNKETTTNNNGPAPWEA